MILFDSKLLYTTAGFCPDEKFSENQGAWQEPTEPGNTSPWLADNKSPDLNNDLWLVVYFVRLVPGTGMALVKV